MTEDQKRLWEVRLGILGSITTFLTVFLGIFYFFDQQRHSLRIESDRQRSSLAHEFKQAQFTQKQAAFQRAAELMGQLATSTNEPEAFKKMIHTFGGHYWGAMILNEDKVVASAMADYRQILATTQPNNENHAARLKDKTDQTLKVLKSALERDVELLSADK